MLYRNRNDWQNAQHRAVALCGLSGVGKSHLSHILQTTGQWTLYSIDDRIAEHHLAPFLGTPPHTQPQNTPFRQHNNLACTAHYLGKPGAHNKGGIDFDDYIERQKRFQSAERATLLETQDFITKTTQGFICDTGGSLCELVNPDDNNDPILNHLANACLIMWLQDSPSHKQKLIKRFARAPKPMAYNIDFIANSWSCYQRIYGVAETDIDPNAFALFLYKRAIPRRHALYQKIAENWGCTMPAQNTNSIDNTHQFVDSVGQILSNYAAQ